MDAGNRRARLLTAVAGVGGVAVALLVWSLWPSAPSAPGAERVRQYSDVRACLLTGPDGVAGPVAAAAWAGMRGASASSRAMVSYLPVPGPASTRAAVPYLASLVQRQCSVIVAVGRPQVAAAASQAARYGRVRFIVITPGRAGPGVVLVPSTPAARVHAAVQAAVSAAVNG